MEMAFFTFDSDKSCWETQNNVVSTDASARLKTFHHFGAAETVHRHMYLGQKRGLTDCQF